MSNSVNGFMAKGNRKTTIILTYDKQTITLIYSMKKRGYLKLKQTKKYIAKWFKKVFVF